MFICSTIAAMVVDFPVPTEPVQDQPVLVAGEQLEALGQPQVVHGSDVTVDHAEDDFDPKPLTNHTGAIAGELVFICKI
jgi:hypothetical protein